MSLQRMLVYGIPKLFKIHTKTLLQKTPYGHIDVPKYHKTNYNDEGKGTFF